MPAPPPAGEGVGGAVLPLVIHPDPRLRIRCEAAGDLPADALRRMARDLLATMYASGGRGLAAPQVGIARRVFVMDAGWKDGAPAPLVMLDPEIAGRSDEQAVEAERCLSIPGMAVPVGRAVTVEVFWYDLDGAHHRRILSGAAARIVQHEADHLDGRLILDGPA